MSATAKVITANRELRPYRISRKSSTNEWLVSPVGGPRDGLQTYYTDDVDDAISTAKYRDTHELVKPPMKKSRAYRVKSKKAGTRQGASIRELDTVGQQAWEITLRRGGKPEMRIIARGAEQYRRALVGMDLWTRGATKAQVERAVGKHIDQ